MSLENKINALKEEFYSNNKKIHFPKINKNLNTPKQFQII